MDVVTTHAFPLFLSRVAAGFPSPADDFLEGHLDLNQYVIRNPAATFFVRVAGDSMVQSGIFPEDVLVVDRSLNVVEDQVVVAVVEGQLVLKRLARQNGQWLLLSDNPAYQPITIRPEADFSVWGVATYVIHQL